MKIAHWFRPTPALIISILALIIATSGGAYAVVQSRQPGNKVIKVNSLSGNRLKNDSVTGKKIKESTLGKVPSAAKADSLPALVWHPITLTSSFTTFSTALYGGPAMYAKDALGFVHLKGALHGATTDNRLQIGTLPSGFRPADGGWVPLGVARGDYNPYAASLWISPDGVLEVENDDGAGVGANNYFVSLEGVQFWVG